MARRLNDRFQERFTLIFDHTAPGVAAGEGAATATITCVAKASLADTDYITIPDGINAPVLYEFDTAGDGVTGGRVQVDVSADTTAAQVAARLRTAILANQPTLDVTDNADGTLTLTHKWPGAGGNVTITENVANAGFLVSGFTGGTAVGSGTGSTTTHKLMTAQRKMRVDKVEYTNPTGLAGHSANYWEIALKKGATTMAQWSTDSDVVGQGTLTANAVVNLVLSGTDANLVANTGDVISLVLTKAASAANLPSGRVVIHGRYV